jgi:hypothetical protein
MGRYGFPCLLTAYVEWEFWNVLRGWPLLQVAVCRETTSILWEMLVFWRTWEVLYMGER